MGEENVQLYYYHGDHLGSAQLVTKYDGEIYEQLEYTPYGELWVEHLETTIETTPFRFTGKERDSETGLYYFGARYLNPQTSMWLSADPAMGEYIPQAPINDEAKQHNQNLPGGGIFNTMNFHTYHYSFNNPINYSDPDGRNPPLIPGIQGMLPVVDDVNVVKNDNVNALIGGFASIWNSAAGFVNGTTNYFLRDLPNAVDNLITIVDDWIPDGLSLSGAGLKEDLYIMGLITGMDPVMAAQAIRGGQAFLRELSTLSNNTKLSRSLDILADWLGPNVQVKTNSHGDKVFLSENGTRRIRFDINHPYPHNDPHGHIEILVDGKWRDYIPGVHAIYPSDVIQ
jgi:RHS repeat-associated protein